MPWSLNKYDSIVVGGLGNCGKGACWRQSYWSTQTFFFIFIPQFLTNRCTSFSWFPSLRRCSCLSPSVLWRSCTKCPVPLPSHRPLVFRNSQKTGPVGITLSYIADRFTPYNSRSDKLSYHSGYRSNRCGAFDHYLIAFKEKVGVVGLSGCQYRSTRVVRRTAEPVQ